MEKTSGKKSRATVPLNNGVIVDTDSQISTTFG